MTEVFCGNIRIFVDSQTSLLSLKSHSSTFKLIRQCKEELNRQFHSRRDISRLQSILTGHWLIANMPIDLILLSTHTMAAVRTQK